MFKRFYKIVMKRSLLLLLTVCCSYAYGQAPQVSKEVMQEIYEEVKTPHKYGLVVVPDSPEKQLDCPSIYRMNNKWYMTYIVFDGQGYETWLAESKDLLDWKTLGRQLSESNNEQWDGVQKAGYNALIDTKWGGSYKPSKFDNKYWMSYFGGNSKGYEPEPLSLGIAYTTKKINKPHEWERLNEPIFTSQDKDVRWWENRNKLFKSYIIEDPERNTGSRFVMYYNAVGDSLENNKPTRWYERIGMAVSDDMVNWSRYLKEPVVHHPVGITGDPMIQRINGHWVMFYFGAFWENKEGAFNRFAVSKDLVNWTDWQGEDLIASSEPYDAQYAHKSFVIKHKGTVYHFYCAVDKDGNRGIALASSKDLGNSEIEFIKNQHIKNAN